MKNMFNAYVNYCNAMEAKRDAARKASREAHPTFYKIMDVISTIMVIVGGILMIYSAIQYVAEKVSQFKAVVNKMTAKFNAVNRKMKADDEEAMQRPNEVESEEEVIA